MNHFRHPKPLRGEIEMMPLAAGKPTRGNRERGQAILELLPVVALMLTLTFGVIDFGRLIWQQEVITALTREGSDVASRITGVDVSGALAAGGAAVIGDGASLNLAANGKVILTAVTNEGTALTPLFVMTGQYVTGSLSAPGKIGTYVPGGTTAQNTVTLAADSLPGVTVAIPTVGTTTYITEVYDSFSPITPLGAFVTLTLPSQLYDVAYY
jgi:hypothetical protein